MLFWNATNSVVVVNCYPKTLSDYVTCTVDFPIFDDLYDDISAVLGLINEIKDNNKIFFYRVSHDGVILGEGKGKSKKAAEQEAAYHAILKLHKKNIK